MFYSVMSRLAVILITCGVSVVFAADNLKMDGTLVAEPCSLSSSTTDFSVDFKNIIDKDLYARNRTESHRFTIDLVDCDPTLGKSVNISFQGAESSALPGLLAIDSGEAKGIAIGIETEEGKPVKINSSEQSFNISGNTLHLVFQGYVEGEPDALANHQIVLGNFSSNATFELTYP